MAGTAALRLPLQPWQPPPIPPRQRQPRAIAQDDAMLSGRERLDVIDAVGVDDGGAVGAQKGRRGQARGGARESVPYEIGVAAGVELDVVAGGADPYDFDQR